MRQRRSDREAAWLRPLLVILRQRRGRGTGYYGGDITFRKSAVKRGKIIFDELLVVRDCSRKLRFKGLQQFKLCIGGCEVGAARNVTASRTDLGVEPNQVQVNLVGFDVIFVVAVDFRW